jgi:hypothetical protein
MTTDELIEKLAPIVRSYLDAHPEIGEIKINAYDAETDGLKWTYWGYSTAGHGPRAARERGSRSAASCTR